MLSKIWSTWDNLDQTKLFSKCDAIKSFHGFLRGGAEQLSGWHSCSKILLLWVRFQAISNFFKPLLTLVMGLGLEPTTFGVSWRLGWSFRSLCCCLNYLGKVPLRQQPCLWFSNKMALCWNFILPSRGVVSIIKSSNAIIRVLYFDWKSSFKSWLTLDKILHTLIFWGHLHFLQPDSMWGR